MFRRQNQKPEEQDTASTMQKTGWTIHSSFLVLPGLEKGFTLNMITRGELTGQTFIWIVTGKLIKIKLQVV